MIILLVHIHVKTDSLAAFEAATDDNARNSRREPGVVRFDVLRQQDDPTRFVFIEVYRNDEAVAAHKTTEHYVRWRQNAADMMAEPRIGTMYTNVSPGEDDW
jgi:autoinducer 2-degrading protein